MSNTRALCFPKNIQVHAVSTSVSDSWLDPPGQVQKLQSVVASRASQYSHDAKRKEREAAKLKERLSQLLVDRKDKKLGKCARLRRKMYSGTVGNKLIKRRPPVSPN